MSCTAAFRVAACLLLAELVLAGTPTKKQGEFIVATVDAAPLTMLSPAEQERFVKALVGTRFDRSELDPALERARGALQDLGFFRALVGEPLVETLDTRTLPGKPEAKPVQLRFLDISLGEQYRMGEVHWNGVKVFPLSKVEPLFLLRPGDIFDLSKVRQSLEAVRKLYEASSYFDMVFSPETRISPENRTIDLTFTVEEGTVYRLTSVAWEGIEAFPASTLEQFLPVGDVYSDSKVQQAIKKVKSLYAEKGYLQAEISFDRTPIHPPKGTREDVRVNVTITVREGARTKQ